MTDKTEWPVIRLTVETEAAEAAEFALNELGAEGTSYSLLAKPDKPIVVITGYFESILDLVAAEGKVIEALKIYGFGREVLFGIDSGSIIDQDWLAEWKKHWKPTFTERFVVAPAWKEVDAGGRTVILIEPGMAFGTGTHETTRLCLRAIEEAFVPGMSFLDVGTGTGILGIAASILAGGESRIAACDTDPLAVEIAIENARLNGALDIDFGVGSIDEDTSSADFVCANLTAAVILPILPLLVQKTGSILVLSGVLAEQAEELKGELSNLGHHDPLVSTDGEWVSITVRKTS